MSEQTTTETTDKPSAQTDADKVAEQTTTDKPKPETDWRAEARKWEQRAKENIAAAKKLAEIEEATKSEAQRQADRLTAAEKDASDARREALRLRVATRHGVSEEDMDLFLTASDEDTLTRQAERLAAREADRAATAAADEAERRKNGNVVTREGHGLDQHNDRDTVALEILGFGT